LLAKSGEQTNIRAVVSVICLLDAILPGSNGSPTNSDFLNFAIKPFRGFFNFAIFCEKKRKIRENLDFYSIQ